MNNCDMVFIFWFVFFYGRLIVVLREIYVDGLLSYSFIFIKYIIYCV